MKSRKDKLTKAALRQAEKALGDANPSKLPKNNMGGLVQQIETDSGQPKTGSKKTKIDLPKDNRNKEHSKREDSQREVPREDFKEEQNMSTPRDSVYNISSDIRLEDYVEENQSSGSGRNPVKTLGLIALVLFSFYAVYRFIAYLNTPNYKLAIANEYIDEKRMADISDENEPTVTSAKPVYIRFQWENGGLKTDYLRIEIHKKTPNGKKEEAVLGRRKPLTANYIYFMGPLENGDYTLDVMDRKGTKLKTKDFQVR